MKKILYLFIAAALMLTIIAGLSGTALADSNYSISVTPDSISASVGQTVTFSANISNNSGSGLSGYSVQSGDATYYSTENTLDTGNGVSVQFTKSLTVTDKMVSDGYITFYLCSNGQQLASCSVTVSGGGGGSGQANIGVTVTPNSTTTNLYKAGDLVTFTFTIVNQGSVTASGITVKSGSKKVTTPFDLSPGGSQAVTYGYTFSKAVTLNFTVIYTANGESLSKTIDPITLGVENRDVKAKLTVDNNKPDPGEEVTFTLEITNSGNVPYTKMTVSWNGQSQKSPSSTLNQGDDLKKTYPMSFDVSEDVQFTITMTDQKGQKVSISTNTVSIYLPIDEDALKTGVTFSVKADRKEMTSGGTINFTGYVSNMSIYDLTNVTISDPAAGTIFSGDIAAESSAAIKSAVDISATTTYNFVLSYTDRDKKTYTANADAPITVTVLESDDDSPAATASGGAEVTNVPLNTQTAADNPKPAATASGGAEVTNVPLNTQTAADNPKTAPDPLLVWIIAAVVLVILIFGVGIALIVLWRRGNAPVRVTVGKSTFKSPKTSKPAKPLKSSKPAKPLKSSKPSLPRSKGPVKGGYGKPKGRSFRDRNHF